MSSSSSQTRKHHTHTHKNLCQNEQPFRNMRSSSFLIPPCSWVKNPFERAHTYTIYTLPWMVNNNIKMGWISSRMQPLKWISGAYREHIYSQQSTQKNTFHTAHISQHKIFEIICTLAENLLYAQSCAKQIQKCLINLCLSSELSNLLDGEHNTNRRSSFKYLYVRKQHNEHTHTQHSMLCVYT